MYHNFKDLKWAGSVIESVAVPVLERVAARNGLDAVTEHRHIRPDDEPSLV